MAYVPESERLSRLKPTAVNRVLQDVRKAQSEGLQPVSLMRGQPDTPTPAHVVEAARKALRDGRTGYPDNRGEPALGLRSSRKSGVSRASRTTRTARS